MHDTLRCLGVDGSSGRPLDPIPADRARRWAKKILGLDRPPRYGIASSNLRSAGWGVVFPEGVHANIREALQPLLAKRRRQARSKYKELTYLRGESSADFRNRLRSGHGRVEPRQVPWYLLLVGNPEHLPFSFELDLDVPHAVGRLAFDNVDDLAAYAERVARLDDRPGKRRPRSVMFAPTHPDDLATAICTEHLARPMARRLAERSSCCKTVIGGEATRAELLDLFGLSPDLFFIVGHAVGYAKGHRRQRSRQGAILCADWPGPVQWTKGVPPEMTVAGKDLPQGAGAGMAVLFGCHTAGTPTIDRYDSEDLEAAWELTPQPFVAALAQRLLGREGDCAAVLGHVGRAFEASCFWRGVRQDGPFEDAIDALLDGRRLGEALDGFGQRFADLAVTWAQLKIEPGESRLDPLDLWLAFHDARSWSLLGDPAVRLPIASLHDP
ncbi:MAG: hypothetical protein AAF657_32275 [Acidobacteriota bacterium]